MRRAMVASQLALGEKNITALGRYGKLVRARVVGGAGGAAGESLVPGIGRDEAADATLP